MIVIIAILAAITVVSYNGIQNRARDAKRASDIETIRKGLITYDITNSGTMSVDSQNVFSANNNFPQAGNTVYYYYCYLPGSGSLPATANVRIGYHKSDGTAQETSFAGNACT